MFAPLPDHPHNRLGNSLALLLLLSLTLTGCLSSSPEEAAKTFLKALASNDSAKALDQVCVDKGPVVIVAIRAEWKNDTYKVLQNDGQLAKIQIRGRIFISDKEWKSLVESLVRTYEGGQWPPDLPRPDKWPVSVSAGLDIDFDSLALSKDGNRWCVLKSSVVDFYKSMIITAVSTK